MSESRLVKPTFSGDGNFDSRLCWFHSKGPYMAGTSRPRPDPAAFPSGGTLADQATFLLSYAILAPSSHNSQPWVFDVEEDTIRLYADETRRLDVADPDGRELYLSLGCALENLLIAADRFGLEPSVAYPPTDSRPRSPESHLSHAATVQLHPNGPSSPQPESTLFQAIPERQTNHHPFEATPVLDSLLEEFEGYATAEGVGLELVTDDHQRETIAALQTSADEQQFADPEYRAELGHWIGTGALGANWLAARIGQLAVRHLDMGEREGTKNSRLITSAPVVGVLTSDVDDRKHRLKVGQVFERLALAATSEGLAVHPMSQILEVDDLRAELAGVLDLDGPTPLHLFRLGRGEPESTRTPRRPLEAVLR